MIEEPKVEAYNALAHPEMFPFEIRPVPAGHSATRSQRIGPKKDRAKIKASRKQGRQARRK